MSCKNIFDVKKVWPSKVESYLEVNADIRACCHQSVHAFTSRYDFTLLGHTFCTPKVFLHDFFHLKLRQNLKVTKMISEQMGLNCTLSQCTIHNQPPVIKPSASTSVHDICDWIWKTDRIVTLAQVIATLIHYPFTVALPGFADWSAFLKQVLLTM